MIHFGDITKIKGANVPLVDIVTGGSPCQDLSVAGKRAGLAGERSGLFMEQIRVIKEMREHDRANGRADVAIRPRFMVWENVPGAFSSNHGEDFRAVLEETAKVAKRDASIPGPPGGKWPHAGCIMGDGWSIAWRVHDAQFWGVPQRRKRISLVADFGGTTAPEILFERKGVSGDLTESGEPGKDAATDVRAGIEETGRAVSFQERAEKPGGGKGILIQNERTGALSTLNNQSVCCLNDQGGSQMNVSEDKTGTLRAQEHGHQPLVFEPGAASRVGGHVYENDVAGTVRANAGDNQQAVVYGISAYESNAMKSGNPNSGVYEAETARTLDLNGGSPACNQGGMAVVSMATKQLSQNVGDNVAMPICANDYKEPQVVCLEGNGSRPSHRGDGYVESETMYTLNSTEHHAVAVENHPADSRVKISEDGMVQTLSGRMGTGGGNVPMVMEEPYKDPQTICNSVVRRLTPLECERLQGYPDGWTDIGEWMDSKGKKHKDADSPRYKALGNSIALPFWIWMAKRTVRLTKNDEPTMASLFDGIGGFPLSFSRAGVKPVWASEIEEFPIAVTRFHFGNNENGDLLES